MIKNSSDSTPAAIAGSGIEQAAEQLRILRRQLVEILGDVEQGLTAARETLRDHQGEIQRVTASEALSVFREVESHRDAMNAATGHLISAVGLLCMSLKRHQRLDEGIAPNLAKVVQGTTGEG